MILLWLLNILNKIITCKTKNWEIHDVPHSEKHIYLFI